MLFTDQMIEEGYQPQQPMNMMSLKWYNTTHQEHDFYGLYAL